MPEEPHNDDDWGFPFHPTCFEIFKKISTARLGKVDITGLFRWRSVREIPTSLDGQNLSKPN